MFNRKKIQSVDLTLNTENGVFNHRVAAVIINNNKILAQKNTKTREYYLVGGRVKFEESTQDALTRELKEELGITVTDFKLLWINEAFFIEENKKFHEICMYYFVDISETKFDRFEDDFQIQEGNRINTYEWLDIDSLDDVTLYPQFFKNETKNPNNTPKLIITKEY